MVSCDRSNESYWAARSCGTVCYAVQGGFNFWVWMKSYGVTIQMKATDYYVPVVLFVVMYKMVLPYLELYLKSYCVTFQMNTLHQYFHIVLLLYQDVLIAWSFDVFFFCISMQFERNENGFTWLQLLLLCNKKPSSIESTCQPYWAFNIKYITSIQSNCVKNDTQKGYSNSEETLLHADQLLNTWPAPNVSGFIAQLVEHRTGTARSRVQAPLKSWIFFFFFRLLYAIA